MLCYSLPGQHSHEVRPSIWTLLTETHVPEDGPKNLGLKIPASCFMAFHGSRYHSLAETHEKLCGMRISC